MQTLYYFHVVIAISVIVTLSNAVKYLNFSKKNDIKKARERVCNRVLNKI